uniref:Uncharacterized protein n=1 Tax=Parascaris equorum TaxID=6256 RepID=A0A914S5H7_PAREQ
MDLLSRSELLKLPGVCTESVFLEVRMSTQNR